MDEGEAGGGSARDEVLNFISPQDGWQASYLRFRDVEKFYFDSESRMLRSIKEKIKAVPVVGRIAQKASLALSRRHFAGSKDYWEERYRNEGTSGPGSIGRLAVFKAEVINGFVEEHDIHSVIEFGCGDGNQLALAQYPSYIGLDVSKTAILLCSQRFQNDYSKSFFLYDQECFIDRHSILTADLALSLDVIFHLVEDQVFDSYMKHLFAAADRFVIIYSSDTDKNPLVQGPSFRNRKFSSWIESNRSDWKLLERIPNKYPYQGDQQSGSVSDFFIYQKA